MVSARRSSSALWGRCPAVVERDISRKVDGRRGPTAWSPRSPDLTLIDFFLRGHLKEQVYAVRPMTIEDLVARLQAAVTTVDANMLRRVRENAVRRTAICLQMDGGRFEYIL
jgi:hypothetical protein